MSIPKVIRFLFEMRRSAGLRILLFAFVALATAEHRADAQWTSSGDDIYNTNSANVGIGTSSPGAKLEVSGGAGNVISSVRSMDNGSWALLAIGRESWEGFLAVSNGTDQVVAGSVASDFILRSTGGNILFSSDNGSSVAMFVKSNGNVGIGTTSPTSKLSVDGDVTVTGNIAAKYQDLAEWVPASSRIAPGSVVVLDPNQTNTVTNSSKAYDTHVAGVVSATPGIVLGEAGEGKVKVATTGRVKVHVDASKSPIQIGDLLVTSGQSGVAMRSEPLDLGGVPIHRPGTLIGKALEPLAEGEGEILVLLSLQ